MKHHQHFSEEEDATKIEQTLESTAIYEEFCGLFEEQMEKLIGEVNPKASADDFIKALKAASEMQAEDEQGSIADVMIASSEFPVFVKLMAHFKAFMNAGASDPKTFGEQPVKPSAGDDPVPEPENDFE